MSLMMIQRFVKCYKVKFGGVCGVLDGCPQIFVVIVQVCVMGTLR